MIVHVAIEEWNDGRRYVLGVWSKKADADKIARLALDELPFVRRGYSVAMELDEPTGTGATIGILQRQGANNASR